MILVTGATGNVGRPLVAELAASDVKVRALTRDPSTALLPAGVEAARTDELGAALEGVEAVFLNPAVFWDGPAELLRLAAERGVRRVVTMSSSSVVRADVASDSPIVIHHRELEAEVETACTESGMRWTHLRPDVFATNTLGWAPQVRESGVVRTAYAQAHSAPVHEADIAAVAALALTEAAGLDGAGPVLTGPESVTQAEQARLIGEAVGKPVSFEEISREEAQAALVAQGAPGGVADTLLDMAAQGVGTPAEVSPAVERLTGRPAPSYAAWARDHADDFR
ncbi:NmrA family NAD(P)-binding protein [Streptomyces iconiensis]|uniref:NAD(P)H-binding protein n=1 Tax=Streptomyces iconiensis TaxID=1384038 RepID=A0ABT6ZYI7_9ACTN|nr:NmrA family NAD(P)-binding protein [Streptomyces iconiensis]MDJ1134140.1 NAD(P)H-binding protein [Streptomyces iconiensis]